MACLSNDLFSENQSCQYGGLINCQILEGFVLPALIFQACLLGKEGISLGDEAEREAGNWQVELRKLWKKEGVI